MHNIVREAVELEHEFCCEALSCALVGMNAKLMGQYIDYVADRLLVALGCEKLYNTANPFDWMEMISLQVRLLHGTPFTCTITRQRTGCSERCYVISLLFAWKEGGDTADSRVVVFSGQDQFLREAGG